MEKIELWHEMLTTYCHLMHYENGITVPNMIGAYYRYDNTIDLSSSECVVQVFNDITDSQKDGKVLIHRCGGIHNYILSIFKGTVPEEHQLNDKIYLGLNCQELHKHYESVDALGEYLYKLHREEITTKNFSYTDESWHPLSKIETGHIDNIIKTL